MQSTRNKGTVLIAYVPAPHRGYLELFRKYKGARLFILGDEYITEHKSLTRHLPGASPRDVRRMVDALGVFSRVDVLSKRNKAQIGKSKRIVMPDEDVMRTIAARDFKDREVGFDDSWRLRWDWGAATADRTPEGEIHVSFADFNREIMRLAQQQSKRSPDWWRQIGAALVRDREPVLIAFNQHVPYEQSAYLEGDPRSSFGPGERIDVSMALHAEMAIIAEAARRGVSTEGCDLYVTTFPCAPCAYACSRLGLRRLYYLTGYSQIHGAPALTAKGVQIVRVQM